jgi:hypothetical protein
MKSAKTLISAAILLLCGLASSGAIAQGVSVSAGGVSVSTGGGTTSTGSMTSGLISPLTSGAGTSEQEQALAAVKSQRAIGLDKIMAAARGYTDGEIIDAQLITVRGFLLYDLKVLDSKGDVGDLYFYAQSGKIVQTK